MGRIEIDHVKEEERRIVLKEASGRQAFSITYQKEYPNSEDEYLVRRETGARRDGVHRWCGFFSGPLASGESRQLQQQTSGRGCGCVLSARPWSV